MKTKLRSYTTRLVTDNPPTAVPTRAEYIQGELVVTFSDGKVARVQTTDIPALANATESDYADLDASVVGVCLMNDTVDMAVAAQWFYEQAV
ncbi:hypothetical protein [Leptothoe sp. PORK10 BA2]|uniref:hypothetical protein n=1 Tax=Leptothoe sp. PORK10 BA2 TaxID=3110254 RepID=UPI002B1FA55E|nr:hypothetical protein [Leptothoe sp. PORK10 BA2]MEA5464514.1 hypothetical protein [Leptothoe sp. PORK10 BA2]